MGCAVVALLSHLISYEGYGGPFRRLNSYVVLGLHTKACTCQICIVSWNQFNDISHDATITSARQENNHIQDDEKDKNTEIVLKFGLKLFMFGLSLQFCARRPLCPFPDPPVV